MKLYDAQVNVNSRKIFAVARELDLPIELMRLDMMAGEHKRPEFLKLNPNGKVPTLVDGSFAVWESNAIMLYLVQKHGKSKLLPTELKARAEVDQWLFWQTAHLQAAYHWINVGVDWEPDSRMNPFTMLKDKYLPEDLIVVKLDVDSTTTEMPLAKQLLNDPVLQSLVDHFYFEHHVHMRELSPNWGSSMQGTMHESLQLFYKLRQKGIAAHYWV